MTLRSLPLYPLLFLFSLTLRAALFSGQSVGLDFGDVSFGNWNAVGLNEDIADLKLLSDGVSLSGVALDVQGQEFADGGPGVGAQILAPFTGEVLDDWGGVFTNPGSWTFTLQGLNDALSYDLQVAAGQISNSTVNSISVSADGQSTGSLGSLAADNQYGFIQGLRTDGFGNLQVTVAGATTSQSAFISGAVLTAIPEPSSCMLLGGASLLLAAFIRRRD